jgi:hypothetical protein
MKLKLTPIYLVSFLTLVFGIHELHDWAHALTARLVCTCWGTREFDFWTFCPGCTASSGLRALAWLAGPLISYIMIWTSWTLMHPENPLHKKALGFSLLFASLPFLRILAALAGGGDETASLRLLFQHADGSNRHIVALAGLLLVLLLNLPALLRAFRLLPGSQKKIVIYLPFLLLPGYLDNWIVHTGLNKLAAKGILAMEVFPGMSLAVIAWSFLLLILWLLTGKSLSGLFEQRETAL